MRYTIIFAFSCLMIPGVPAAAGTGDMSVATFLEKADTLKGKGLGAMFSGDIKLLKGEAQAAGEAYRARIVADKKAGRPPHSCPPPGKQSMGSGEFLGHLRSYPEPARKTTTIKVAFADLMRKRYPCR